MIVVADASTIIGLHRIGRLDLLRAVFGEIHIPPSVAAELVHADPVRNVDVRLFPWIRLSSPDPGPGAIVWRKRLDPGESDAIALALERNGKLVAGDGPGRKEAIRLGLDLMGLVGVAVAAKRLGAIPAMRDLFLDLVTRSNFRIKREILNGVLVKDGEEPI